MKPAPRKYYSQGGEDFLLWRIFERRCSGFYVDVGAFDGVHLSNTFSFEQQGWTGICIEPHPTYFALCQRARPMAICLNTACVGNDHLTQVEFYVEELGLLSGVLANRTDDTRKRYEWRGLEFQGFGTVNVPANTLNAILSRHLPADTELDFISIDVEGSELEVLQGIDLCRYRPRVLVVEANSEEAKLILSNYLAVSAGYVEARQVGVNVFYSANNEDTEILRRTPIDCQIEKQIHPLGTQHTLQEYVDGKTVREHRQRGEKSSHMTLLRRLAKNLLQLD